MRGTFEEAGHLFSYISPEARVPATHPLRRIRELVRAVLKELSPSFGSAAKLSNLDDGKNARKESRYRMPCAGGVIMLCE